MAQNTCVESWTTYMVAGHCKDCQLSPNSCICLKCFLYGHHQHHNSTISVSTSGNCDCGDPYFWKRTGFCSVHHGPELDPDKTQLTPELRTALVTSFTAIINYMYNDMDPNLSFNLIPLATFLVQFIKLGDGIRRCMAIAFSRTTDPNQFFNLLKSFREDTIDAFLDILGGLVNDSVFMTEFGYAFFRVFLNIENEIGNYVQVHHFNGNHNERPLIGLIKFIDFSFHFFSMNAIESSILIYKFDWPKFLSNWLILTYGSIDLNPAYIRHMKVGYFWKLWTFEKTITAIHKIEKSEGILYNIVKNMIEIFSQREASYIDSWRPPPPIMPDDFQCVTYYFFSTTLIGIAKKISKCVLPFDFFHLPLFEFLQHAIIGNQYDFAGSVGNIHNRTILSYKTNYSPVLPLHALTWNLLKKYDQSLTIVFREITKNIGHDIIAKSFALLPLRYLSVIYLSSLNLFRFNPPSLGQITTIAQNDFSSTPMLLIYFSIIQGMFGLIDNKEEFIEMIVNTFGLFDHHEELDNASIEFVLIHFIICLYFDRTCINNDKLMINRLHTFSLLKLSDLSMSKLEKKLGKGKLANGKYAEDLEKYTQRVQTEDGVVFKLIDDSEWVFANPWDMPKDLLNQIPMIEERIPNLLFQMPTYTDLPFGLEITSSLESPILYAIMYRYFSNLKFDRKESKKEAVHHFLNLFALMASHAKEVELPHHYNIIETSSLKQLIKLVPHDFHIFVRTPINFHSSYPITLIQLILETTDHIGESVLLRANVGYEKKVKNEEEQREVKENVKAMKELIIDQYQRRIKQFQPQLDAIYNTDQCTICKTTQQENVFCYPCIIYTTCLPSFMQNKLDKIITKVHNAVQGFYCCSHIVHSTCFNEHYNRCIICNGTRNALLPKIDGFQPQPTAVLILIQNFIKKMNQDLVLTFAGLLTMTEIRFRSRPEIFDDDCLSVLLRNIFLSIWHINYGRKFNHNRSDPFVNLIAESLNSLNPYLDFPELLLKYGKTMNGIYLFQFLRKAAIFQHFSLQIPLVSTDTFVDWDYVLSHDFLMKKYDFKSTLRTNASLEVFQIIPLPDLFIELSSYPYNFDIIHYDKETAIDMFTKDIVSLSRRKVDYSLPSIESHLSMTWRSSSSMYLVISGPKATQVLYYSKDMYMVAEAKPIYVDKNGEPDVGVSRGQLVHLNKERLNEVIDTFISGKWIENARVGLSI